MNTTTLVIGNKNYSSWSLRPWFFLSKNQVQFTEQQLWLDEPEFRSSINRYNSGGKVPVLLDSGAEIWDSLAIIEYVIESFDCAYGWPEEKKWRAHARSGACEMHSSFPALRNECPMDIRGTREIELSDAAARDIQRVCEIWTQALEMSGRQGRWLYGEFSAADAMFAPVVFRFNSFAIEVSPLIREYMQFVMQDAVLAKWAAAARQETRQIIY